MAITNKPTGLKKGIICLLSHQLYTTTAIKFPCMRIIPVKKGGQNGNLKVIQGFMVLQYIESSSWCPK